jgi:hypothetical protein
VVHVTGQPFLDQHRTTKIVAMVESTTHANRVALEVAHSWRSLTRVGHAGLRAWADGRYIARREGCDSAHALHAIECNTLAHEDGSRAATYSPQFAARRYAGAVRRVFLERQCGIDERKYAPCDTVAGDHHWLSRIGNSNRKGGRRDARLGREIAAAEILCKCAREKVVKSDPLVCHGFLV